MPGRWLNKGIENFLRKRDILKAADQTAHQTWLYQWQKVPFKPAVDMSIFTRVTSVFFYDPYRKKTTLPPINLLSNA
jgi:hypothetical protein